MLCKWDQSDEMSKYIVYQGLAYKQTKSRGYKVRFNKNKNDGVSLVRG